MGEQLGYCKRKILIHFVLTKLVFFITIVIMTQIAYAMPTVTCDSPFNVIAGTGGQHTVSAVAGIPNITDFTTSPLPTGISFGNLNPPLPTASVSATITVDSSVPAGSYVIDIIATDQD
ncbi:MAG: hypothetical protein C4548_09620 [Desulfobacteraceae bacterium]|jgi:hypothetical protein|nr:MAG: hypothetical protein C4548_09620 [Desulfobacteraceae bacterium]